MSQERLSPQQWAQLELELRKGPLAHGFADDQRVDTGPDQNADWEAVPCRLHRRGHHQADAAARLVAQVPVRQAMERDEETIAVWKDQVWPDIKGRRATWAVSSASRTRQARG